MKKLLCTSPAPHERLFGPPYRFTLWPVLAAIPVFAVLGSLIPVLSSRAETKHSIVERLRQD